MNQSSTKKKKSIALINTLFRSTVLKLSAHLCNRMNNFKILVQVHTEKCHKIPANPLFDDNYSTSCR